MRASTASILSLLLSTTAASSPTYSPFTPPYIDESHTPSNHYVLELFRRQSNCPAGYNACTNLGAPSACCSNTAICSADSANHVACCPLGALCTGTIGAVAGAGAGTTPTAATSGAFLFSTTITTTQPAGITATTFPNTAIITPAPQSVVPNVFFPFVYIPTSYANDAVCSSYYSACQTQFSACTASLGGGVNGVTVNGFGAGITVPGVSITASAAAVCSSLSSQACYGLQLANCQTFGTAAAAATATVFNPNGAGNRCQGMMYGVGVGVAVGLAGQVLS